MWEPTIYIPKFIRVQDLPLQVVLNGEKSVYTYSVKTVILTEICVAKDQGVERGHLVEPSLHLRAHVNQRTNSNEECTFTPAQYIYVS